MEYLKPVLFVILLIGVIIHVFLYNWNTHIRELSKPQPLIYAVHTPVTMEQNIELPINDNTSTKRLFDESTSTKRLFDESTSTKRLFDESTSSKRLFDESTSTQRPLNKSPLHERPLNKHSSDPVDDYYRFPCLEELDLNDARPCVRSVCMDDACGSIVTCTALPLKLVNDIPICTYNPQKDFIARFIKGRGGWENRYIRNMMSVLKANPDMMLVDIGCNIGVYTLAAAWMSRRVVCVDANFENVRMVHTSLALSNLTEYVTLVWNALSYERGVAKLKLTKNNVGASRLEDVSHTFFKVIKNITTEVITLDELQSLVKGKSVFMKMDIEGYELNALKGGKEFLKNIDVRYIQMEFWSTELRLQITKLLSRYGFLAFNDVAGKKRLGKDDLPLLNLNDIYFIQARYLQ